MTRHLVFGMFCIGLAALSACGDRAVGIIDLDSVSTGFYNISSSEHTSDCSDGSSNHNPISATGLAVRVISFASGLRAVELPVPRFTFFTGPPWVVNRMQLTAADDRLSRTVPLNIGCQQQVKYEVVLLDAHDDALTAWYSESWSDRGTCSGGPIKACTSSTLLSYTLTQACAEPCQILDPSQGCSCP